MATNVAKGLKLKVRKFWRLIPTFAEVTAETGRREVGFDNFSTSVSQISPLMFFSSGKELFS